MNIFTLISLETAQINKAASVAPAARKQLRLFFLFFFFVPLFHITSMETQERS